VAPFPQLDHLTSTQMISLCAVTSSFDTSSGQLTRVVGTPSQLPGKCLASVPQCEVLLDKPGVATSANICRPFVPLQYALHSVKWLAADWLPIAKQRLGGARGFSGPQSRYERFGQATLQGSSCTSIMTCTGGCGYSF